MTGSAISGQNLYDVPLSNSSPPCDGARGVRVLCPFTGTQTAFTIDLSLTQAQKFIVGIQTVYVDNSLSASPFNLLVDGLPFSIKFPAGAQGFVPLLCPRPTKMTASSTGGVNVNVIFLNVPIPSIIWGGAAGGAINATIIADTFHTSGTLATAQSTVTSAGQVLDGANPARRGFFIKNNSTVNSVAIGGPGVTFATGFLLGPGDTMSIDGGNLYTGPLDAIADVAKPALVSIAEFTP